MPIRTISNAATLLLAFVGSVVAFLLARSHDTVSDVCGTAGCARALHSIYGHLGPIPTALFGLAMYLILVGLCLARLRVMAGRRSDNMAGGSTETAGGGSDSQVSSDAVAAAMLRQLNVTVWLLATAGACISWFLQYAALFELEVFCKFCFSSACIITAIWLLASRDLLPAKTELSGETKMLIGISGFIIVMLWLSGFPRIHDQWVKVIRSGAENGKVAVSTRDRELLAPAGEPAQGNPDATYVLVEFADYQCPQCRRAFAQINSFLNGQGDKFRFVFRNFPLPMHRWAHLAAEASLAANAQGKYWAMHDALYSGRDRMNDDKGFNATGFADYAAQCGLDIPRFTRELSDHTYASAVDRDIHDAMALGVHETPTFYVIAPMGVYRFKGIANLTFGLQQLKVVK